MSLPTLQTEREKYENTTMYIKNRRNCSKIRTFNSFQTLCLTESFVLRNRLLFLHQPLPTIREKFEHSTKSIILIGNVH